MDTSRIERVTSEECLATEFLYQAFGIQIGSHRLPEVFQNLSAVELSDMLAFLGRMELVVAAGNPETISTRTMSVSRQVLNAGAEVVLAWPDGFETLMDRVKAARPRASGTQDTYGQLYRLLSRNRKSGFWKILMHEFNSVIGRQSAPAKTQAMLLMSEKELHQTLSLGEFAVATLKTSPLWARTIKKIPASQGRNLYVRSEVDVLARCLNDLISLPEASRLLGCNEPIVMALVEAGLLSRQDGVKTGVRWRKFLSKQEITELSQRLHSTAKPPSGAASLTFDAARNRATIGPSMMKAVDVLRGVFDGRLAVHLAAPDQPGFKALSLEIVTLIAFIDMSLGRTSKLRG